MRSEVRLVSSCVLMFCLVLLPPAAQAQSETAAQPSGLSITGHGEYDVAPEFLSLVGNVETEGFSADAILAPHFSVAAKVRKVIDELSGRGLKLVRQNYSLRSSQPNLYDNELPLQERQQRVFTATTSFTFRIDDLSSAPALVSELAKSWIGLGDLHYEVEDDRAALLEARKAAGRDALEQAEAYADALGLTLMRVRLVTDSDAQVVDGYADLIDSTSGRRPPTSG